MDFKNRLKELRLNNNITQAELAKKLNYGRTAIANYEAGRTEPSFEALKTIAEFFGVSIDYLLGRPKMIEPEVVAFHKNTPGDFTDDEKEEIDNFIQYILSKRDKE